MSSFYSLAKDAEQAFESCGWTDDFSGAYRERYIDNLKTHLLYMVDDEERLEKLISDVRTIMSVKY